MIRKAFALGALVALAAAPAFAASRSNPIVSHTGGPIPYDQLSQMDSGKGYNARASRSRHTHMRASATTSAPTASPDAAGPAPTPPDAAAPPSNDLGTSNPVTPPASSTSTTPAPAVTTPPATNSSPQ